MELTHPSPLRDLIGTAIALQCYTGKFFANGARLSGVLKTIGTLNDEQAQRLKQHFESYNSGLF